MRVVVVGGGFGGLASAARLAKLGHEVTLVERTPALGGALHLRAEDGFTWDARRPRRRCCPRCCATCSASRVARWSSELELEPVEVIREHRFEDGTAVRLPGGSRGRQVEAFDALGAGLGQEWVDHVASYADVWETLRRHYLEVPWDARDAAAAGARGDPAGRRPRDAAQAAAQGPAATSGCRLVAGHRFVAEGHDLRNVPAWLGLYSYLEQRFGAWTVPGGIARLAEVARRAARDPRGDGADRHRRSPTSWSATAAWSPSPPPPATLDADAVVVAVDPRRLPALAPYVARTHAGDPAGRSPTSAWPATCRTSAHEVVLHGDPLLVVRGRRAGPGRPRRVDPARPRPARRGHAAGARPARPRRPRPGRGPGRPLPARPGRAWGGSPMGVLWQGRGTVRHRLGPTTPVPGVYAAGAHATPGCRAAVRRPVGGAGRPGDRPGLALRGSPSQVTVTVVDDVAC